MAKARLSTARRPQAFDPGDWPIAWMARAERQHARNATALLAPLGMHHREFRLLAFLGQSEGLSVGELADLAVLERPTVSKMVDRLQLEGWMERTVADPNGNQSADRRRSPLALTALGRAKLAAAVPIVEALFERYREGISVDQQAHFVAELKDFFQRVQAANPGAAPGDPDAAQKPRRR